MPANDGYNQMQWFTEAFGEPYRKVVQNTVCSQVRNVRLAQDWAENLSGLMVSRAETNNALAESLESYREVIDRSVDLQEKNVETGRNFFEGVIRALKTHSDSNLQMAEEMMAGPERQFDAFQKMFQQAMDSYSEMLNAQHEMYRKNMKAFGIQS